MFGVESLIEHTNKQFRGSEPNAPLKCRACLAEGTRMNPMFACYEKNKTLANDIEEIVGYAITEEEQYSKHLCEECTRMILGFITFKRTFQNSTDYFKSLIVFHDIKEETDNIEKSLSESPNVKEEIDYHVPQDCANDLKISDIEKIEPIYQYRLESDLNKCVVEVEKNSKPNEVEKHFCFETKSQLYQQDGVIQQKNANGCIGNEDPLDKESPQKATVKLSTNSSIPDLISTDSKIKCKVCKLIFPIEEFDLHFDTHKKHICNTCGHKFRRKTDWKDHVDTHLDFSKYICPHCGKAFKTRNTFNKHKKIHTNPGAHICDVCGQRFNSRDNLKAHYKQRHICLKPFECYHCGLAFKSKPALQKHLEIHSPYQRMHSCNICNVSYRNKRSLNKHYQDNHAVTKLSCEIFRENQVPTSKFDLEEKYHKRSE